MKGDIMEQEKILTDFRLVDEFGNETRLVKETTIGGTENGIDAYFLYGEFIKFLQAAGFGESTVSKIQYVDDEEE